MGMKSRRIYSPSILILDRSVTVKGGYIPLAGAVKFTAKKKKLSTPQEVLSFNKVWRPLANALRTFLQNFNIQLTSENRLFNWAFVTMPRTLLDFRHLFNSKSDFDLN
jgi:hypothetical protein